MLFKKRLWAAATFFLSMPLAHACGQEDYMGSVCLTAAKFCPEGKLEADGRLMSIAQNQQLYQLLGAAYGGNGSTTFALPDLRRRAPVGRAETAAPGPFGAEKVFRGQAIGNSSTSLSIAQLPPHNHPFTATGPGTSIDVQLRASTSPAKSDTPSTANKYLAPISAELNSEAVTAKYWTDTPGTPVPVGGVTATITGGGGTVGATGGGQSFSTQSPSLGMTYCIEVRGLYPPGGP